MLQLLEDLEVSGNVQLVHPSSVRRLRCQEILLDAEEKPQTELEMFETALDRL